MLALPPPDLQRMAEMRDGLNASLPQTVAALERLGSSVNAVSLFVATIANLLLPPPTADQTSRDLPSGSERLAFHLYPFFGNVSDHVPTSQDCRVCKKLIETLCTQSVMLDHLKDNTGPDEDAHNLADHVRTYTKTVRGSSFPERIAQKINATQGPFEDWYKSKVGIGPKKATEILWAIADLQKQVLNENVFAIKDRVLVMVTDWEKAQHTRPAQRVPGQAALLQSYPFATWVEAASQMYLDFLSEASPQFWSVGRDGLTGEGMPPTPEEWAALIGMLGFTPQVRADISDWIEVRGFPLFVLPDGGVMMMNTSHAMDILWERFDQIARQDSTFHEPSYQPARGKWLEKRAVECLSRVFPKSHIYQGLAYPDLSKPAGATTELDIAIHWGPFLLLVEAKSSQFRLESRLGDVKKLKADLHNIVAEAFNQTRRAARYIESVDKPIFTEIQTGRRLVVDKSNLRRTYFITVSLHELAGLATRLASVRSLKLFKDGELPLSISVADLDTIAQFCEGPDVFLHYIERRLDVQMNASHVHGNELDFFAAYLDNRFSGERLWQEGKQDYHFVMLAGWSDEFDQWMEHRRGERNDAPDLRLQIPQEVRAILQELRSRNEASTRWIAFALLDMPNKVLNAIAEIVREIPNQRPKPGMFLRTAYQSKDVVVAFMATTDLSMPLLYERTQQRAYIEKYRRKVSKCITFGIDLNNLSRPFEYACWLEGEWQTDELAEQLIQEEAPFTINAGSKIPGRNEPCICGSGLKFKKCCLSRMEASRRALG